MRYLIALAMVLAASAVYAAEWLRYENPRFGYRVDVPAGFQPDAPSDNGDGRIFRSGDGTQLVRVYGGSILEPTFEASVEAAMAYARAAGWALSYERVTPRWTSYSGTRNGMILYARAIALCGGTQYASFELEYPQRDLEAMDAVVEHMVASLQATGDGLGC